MNHHKFNARSSARRLLLVFLIIAAPSLCMAQSQDSDSDVKQLITQLKTGSPAQKVDASMKLGRMNAYAWPAASALTEALASDDLPLVYESLLTLGHLGPAAEGAVPAVANLALQPGPLQVTAIDTVRKLGTVSPAVLEKVTAFCQQDEDVEVMIAAVRCHQWLSNKQLSTVSNTCDCLIKALSHERASVRNSAMAALVDVGAPAVPDLAKAAAEPGSTGMNACEALRQIGSPAASAVPALITRLDDTDPVVIRSAARALGGIAANSETVLPALKPLLKHDSAAVRRDAVEAIGRFQNNAVNLAGDVRRLLRDDSNMPVRIAAADALGLIADDRRSVMILLKIIQSAEGNLAIHAANALTEIGTPAVQGLRRLMEEPGYESLAISLLGELGPLAKPALPDLIVQLKNSSEDIRRETYIALAAIGPDAAEAVPQLTEILNDPNSGKQRAGAAYVLGSIGNTDCLDTMKSLAKNSPADSFIGRSAAWALVAMQPEDSACCQLALPALLSTLDSEDVMVRVEGLQAIGNMGSHATAAIGQLAKTAKDDSHPEVKAEALHSLAMLSADSPEAIAVSLVSLDSNSASVRHAATFLLGTIGRPVESIAPKLKANTKAGSQFDRMVAAWALVRVQPSESNFSLALPLILQGLNDPEPRTRLEAVRTLKLAGRRTSEIINALKQASDDSNEQVRKEAKSTLQTLDASTDQ